MNVKTEVDAFRIWAYSQPRGWDVTNREVAGALGLSVHRVKTIASSRGWHHRMRSTRAAAFSGTRDGTAALFGRHHQLERWI